MNQAESERIGARLDSLGYTPTRHPEEASLVVLNTCVVRQHAEEKATQRIEALSHLKARKPGLRLIVTGCLVGPEVEELRKRFPQVDYFSPPGELSLPEGEPGLSYDLPRHKVSTCIPVIQGCNRRCTYCIVPYRRGPERSRPPEEVIGEARKCLEGGSREIVLLGQNINSYGTDLPSRPDLADLLEQLDSLEGLWRIRFLTSHPRDVTSRFIERIALLDRVCKHLSLPLQSGDEHILKLMGRGYDLNYYYELVERIRALIPDVALSTDIIVGFPGEGEAEFQHTLEVLQDIKFDVVHVAAYSPRPGTAAATHFTDDVPPHEKARRLRAVEELQQEIATTINSRLQGKVVEVLITGRRGKYWQGRTQSDKLVFLDSEEDMQGKLVAIRITRTSPWSLTGELAQ